MHHYKIKSVEPLNNYRLSVVFLNGEKKEYDIKPLFEQIEDFKLLQHITGLFEQVTVDVGGYGICWNDNIDLSCNELYLHGKSV